MTLDMGTTGTLQSEIWNSGATPLDFEFVEFEVGFVPSVLSWAEPGVPWFLGAAKPNAPQATAEVAPASRDLVSPLAVGDALFSVDVEAISGDTQNLGLAWADDHWWVTGGNSGSDPNKLYKIDAAGTLVDTFDQPSGCATWGGRDLAFDGTHLYIGCDDGQVHEFDPASGAWTGTTIPGPVSPPRALAYDPDTDHFWTANWGSDIYEFDRSGTVINTFSNALSAYGMAWDRWSSGGPYLWVWSQDGSPQVLATQIDPATGTATGVSFVGADPPGGMAGGADVIGGDHPDYPGMAIFAGLHQATPDTVVGYDLDAVASTDVPWLTEDPISGTLAADTGYVMADIVFDAGAVGHPGDYYADLSLLSNDPVHDNLTYPVTLHVTLPPTFGKLMGTVETQGYCDTNPALLEDAEVLITNGSSITLTTDISGTYSYWLDAGTYTVTISADEHASESAVVVVTAQMTTTQDASLRWLYPCLMADPMAIEEVFTSLGMSATVPLTLTNYGAVSTTFGLWERDGGYIPLAGEDVLVVDDGDDASATAIETSLTNLGYTWTEVDATTFGSTPITDLLAYQAVLIAGGWSIDDYDAHMMDYLDAGGSLFIADNDLGYQYSGGGTFYNTYLQATYVSDDPGIDLLIGEGLMAGIDPNISGDAYPDDFTVGAEGVRIFRFSGGNAAGVLVERASYRAIYLSWDFEYTGADADAVIEHTMQFLAGDVPWLSETPITGTLAADGGSVVVDVTLDSGVPEVTDFGEYLANLLVKSADPMTPNLDLPVTMLVVPSASWGEVQGTVMGLGYCEGDEPIENAEVFIESSLGTTATVWTDVDGFYYKWLDSAENPYTLTVSAPEHETGMAVVNIIGQDVITQDFSLQWLQPIVEVAPTVLSDTLLPPDSVTHTLTITNVGFADLDFEIVELPPAVTSLSLDLSATPQPPEVEVEPQLRAQIAEDGASGYLIYFREAPDLSGAYGMDWEARGRFVVRLLQETAERSQADVRAYLDAQGADYQAFWIDNVIVVESSSEAAFNGLLAFPEIAALRTRRHPILHEPEELNAAVNNGPTAIEPNISHVLADQVWAMGYRGEGMVVANIDTGILWTHEAIEPHYRGNDGNHDYDWWDPYDNDLLPNDPHSHGSHTAGTMVGRDFAGVNEIGMAPGAQLIACQGFNPGSSDAGLLECGQWIAAPWDLSGANPDPAMRPHAVNNSWGDCGQTFDPWYDGVIDAWLAAGIYPVFSNGNASNCGYSYPPGLNTVGNPARSGRVSGVGSTGRSDGQYATHSNWGPTDDPDTINPTPGYENLKPQFLAPGVDIRSATNAGDTAYGSMSGTSMSAPHVTALVALMWQAAPCLVGDYAATETIIEDTATPIPYDDGITPGTPRVPNFATGWGEINAHEAVTTAMKYCGGLDWVDTSVVTGTVPSGSELNIDVTFTCNMSHTLEPQPMMGTLRILHNDPCQPAIEVDLSLICQAPDIHMDEHAMDMAMPADDVMTHAMGITNTGTADLHWTVTENPEVAWMSEVPTQGTTAPGGDSWVDITMDTTGMTNGVYTTTLEIASDDPDEGLMTVPVTLTIADFYTLTVGVVGSGTVDPFVGQQGYPAGTDVVLTAIPDTGWTFVDWTGDVMGLADVITVTVDAHKSVTATFEIMTYTLDIATDGSGSGTTDPVVGSHVYDYGTTVMVTATADTGSEFVGWTGDVMDTANVISITMDADHAVTATFELNDYTLTLNAEGPGTTDPLPGVYTYTYGTQVPITATPDVGANFLGWSGDLGGAANPETLMIDGDKVVTATFTSETVFSLDLATDGAGSGTTDPAVGIHNYVSGTTVMVTATADMGSEFVTWHGDVVDTANVISILMDADHAVTATFDLLPVYTLTLNAAGPGTTDPLPGVYTYTEGTTVPITATPDVGASFVGWSGDLSGTTNPITLTMDANYEVTATFQTGPTCVDVTGVNLSQVTPGPINPGDTVDFSATVEPANATTPYTYTVNNGTPMTAMASPITFDQTYPATGTYTVTLAVWNCAMTTPVEATLNVTVVETTYYMYLPVMMQDAP
jgi:hypothetical protein